jgi:Flp pilus assembly pilin Flp
MRELSCGRSGQGGQGLAEYALILGLIAVVAIAAMTFLGTEIDAMLSVIGNTL